jgi:hypothetical protein
MSTATMNGKPRKQLSQQLDRMDGIIDCLADALPEAVADACRDGAKAAVQQAVTDLFARPEFLARFAELAARSAQTVAPVPLAVPAAATPTPPANARPSSWERMKAKLREWKSAVTGGVRTAADTVKAGVRTAAGTVAATARTLSNTLPVRRILTVAIGVGLFTAAVCYLCPHWLSAVIGGAGAACTAAAVQVGSWLRRSVNMFRFGG